MSDETEPMSAVEQLMAELAQVQTEMTAIQEPSTEVPQEERERVLESLSARNALIDREIHRQLGDITG